MNEIKRIPTQAFKDQLAGTSGLRKKVTIFMQPNYLANFVQSIFDFFEDSKKVGKLLVVSGDGRYFNDEAIQQTIRIAAANGVRKVVVGEHGLLSTPAVSAIIRDLNARKSTFASHKERSQARRRLHGRHSTYCQPQPRRTGGGLWDQVQYGEWRTSVGGIH